MGSRLVGGMIARVGHIRVFASLAAIAAATSLAFVIFIAPVLWVAMRVVMGFCISGLFTVIESWLNEAASNSDRGRVLSIYRLVDLAAVTGSQFVLPAVGVEGFEIFSLMAGLFCLSLVPIALSQRGAPPPIEAMVPFDLGLVWRISPLAVIGIFAVGMTSSAFRALGPLYAGRIGFDIAGVAYFMAAGIVGGAVLQLPFGALSDRYDRRWVLIAATLGAAFAGLSLAFIDGLSRPLSFVQIFLFGAFALPLYSLSVAHANDFAEKGQFAALSAGLLFVYSLGASLGPLLGSLAMEAAGAHALFGYIALVHFALVIVALVRMRSRPIAEGRRRARYTALLRTSPAIFRLARRRLRGMAHRPHN